MTLSNMRTREEWLHAILYSGEVTRIGQHLALVIYHLADPATNTAKLSARDLERITGWSRTAIMDHLSEIEIFIRVTWGAGRAKSLFELQGVIAQVLEEQKAASEPATTAATANTTEVATTPCVRETAGTPAAKADTTVCGSDADTVVASQPATNVPKTPMGGTIGGENNNYPSVSESNTHTHSQAQAPDWMISEDGGFEGKVFELSGAEVAGLAQVYTHLEWPADLVATDQFFAREFDKADFWPPMDSRMAGLHTYLAKQNRKVVELRRTYEAIARSKGASVRKLAQPIAEPTEPPSCWFDDETRLQVANGFKVELLDAVGGDEGRLRIELDKAAGWVGVNVKGPQLIAKVRSRIVDQIAHADKPSKTEQRRERLERVFAKVEAQKAGRRP